MSDNLVKRLRRPWVNADGEEAADRIEELERADEKAHEYIDRLMAERNSADAKCMRLHVGRIEELEARVKELERRERIYRSALDYYARCDRNVAAEALAATEEPRP